VQPAVSRDLFAALEQVSDPRGRQGQRHSIIAMLATVVCATLCGARGFKPIAQWIRMQEPETWHWFGFKWRHPCANCYADLFKVINVEEFEQSSREWTSQLPDIEMNDETLRAISIDGKTLCSTLQQHQRDVCEKILDSGGDYFVVVKNNQPALLRNIELAFAKSKDFSPLPTT
jgi:hypothetical protein